MCADPVGALYAVLRDDDAEVIDASNGVTTALVCTQGSHDMCCGIEGLAFAQWVEGNTDVEVFRVSHTGGHRFAPTAMTLPDGRMWAYLDASTATTILKDRGDATSVAGSCRGWWGAPTGPAQVAERAVFAEVGFALDSMLRSVSVREVDGAHHVEVAVSTGDVYDVTVTLGREVPTIACSSPGGLPAKPGREWTVTHGPALRP